MYPFNQIKSRNELADYLHIPRSKLAYILYVRKVDSYYINFDIPKRSDGVRHISAPQGDLKYLQTRLASAIQNYQSEKSGQKVDHSNILHGFEKGKSIMTNASIHRNKRYIINIDIKDYFDSFHFGRVLGFFEKNNDYNLPHEVAVAIAQIVCYKGKLPQGSPCSPIISNLISHILDFHVLKIAKAYKLDYTRYADDLTFSTNWSEFPHVYEKFLDHLSSVVTKNGFAINEKKTRLIFKDSRQEVTGLVVNKKISVNREYARKTRAMADSLYRNKSFYIDGAEGNINQLEGRFSFINQLDSYNNKRDGRKHNTFHLCRREREYRIFLFYKYFFLNNSPLLITEGKTDINYLKASLKQYYYDYPKLVEKQDDGQFVFKVAFFQRPKSWSYFFGISQGGADAEKTLYHYFTGKGCENIYGSLMKKYGCVQRYPVVFVYDNEACSKRPLKSFLDDNSLLNKVQELQENLYINLQVDSKIFLLINPLVAGNKESEIEDLFLEEVLNTVIGGKTFCRDDKYDKSKYYGKRIFSDYILANYEQIDFSRFRPMLDALNMIVQ